MPNITFINHASVLISDGKDSVLTDPWYDGDILNNGWRLLYCNDRSYISKVLDKTSYIWISHEHPDHFSIKFFNDYKEKIFKNKITLLFQKTKDRRVVNFLNLKGFKVIELSENENFYVNDNFNIHIKRFGFYDSALIANIGDKKIINLNDCVFENKKELYKFASYEGRADILLTQFSYAAWKGGIKNRNWRVKAATEKISRIIDQAQALKSKSVIPFASFNYFSNVENFYMNDSINTPQIVREKIEDKKLPFKLVIMQPGEIQDISNMKQQNSSLLFWNKQYDHINNFPKYSYEKISYDELKLNFFKYQKNIFKNNSKWFMQLVSMIPFLNIFKKINIYLHDLNKTISLSIFEGINISNNENKYHVKMHSNSLNFIFKNEFGYDTLTANGNFETKKGGFSKLTKTLSIGSLNSLGYSFSPVLIFKPEIYLLFLNMLTKVSKNLENPYD